jgi:ABC-2 type transport system permease protein
MGKNTRNRKKNAGRGPSPNPGPRPTAQTPPVEVEAASPARVATLDRPKAPTGPRPERISSGGGPIWPGTVAAVFKRNYFAYFSNPAGYVFITLFVLVCAWAAFWQPVFFARNLANLAPLDDWMPYLLLFFIPAITMNAWAEERRLGTDELLFTLPARDVEIVLGKFLAAVGIYSTALAFSLSLVAILFMLGSPDLGVIVSTYVGYWLMGVMMIAIGLVASSLSSNVTVAFILGAVFCAIPVFAGLLGGLFPLAWKRAIEDLSIPSQYRDFGSGVISLVNVFYFLAMAGAMIYLNMVLIGRRLWSGGERGGWLGLHALVRVVSLIVALASADVLISRYASNVRADVSSEGLHRLSPESLRLIKEIPSDRPVYVEAYYSDDVPRDYVQTKDDLLNKLREFAAESGGRIKLNLVETDLYSKEAREAEKKYGILPRRVMAIDDAKQSAPEIFLGVAFTSGLDEVVVPFFDRGLPVEYELARSMRVVSKTARKKIGVLQTDAKMLGGFDFRAMGQNTEWPFVSELKKQYEVSSVSADTPIPTDLDVLLVAQPSSLTQRGLDNLSAHIKAGRPTLLFVDPLPLVDTQLSPEIPRQSPGGQFGGAPPPEPKGDLAPVMDLLGIDWPPDQIVWNPYSPHPELGDLPAEIVFIARGGAGDNAFNAKQAATSGLEEIVLMCAGELRAKAGGPEFIPLLRTSDEGGTIAWSQLVQPGMMGGMSINFRARHRTSGLGYTLAARIQGKPATPTAPKADEAKAKAEPVPNAELNAIVIADLDLISEQFFDLRIRKDERFDFDNVTFVLNCVDVLAGDDSYIELRKRRVKHRTLTRLEERTKTYVDDLQAETKSAEDAAVDELAAATKRLEEKIEALRKRTDLDERTKEIMLGNSEAVERRRLDVEKKNIEDAKRRKIADSKADMELNIRNIQRQVRLVAMVVPPLPAVILGLIVFAVRIRRENRGANPNRLA